MEYRTGGDGTRSRGMSSLDGLPGFVLTRGLVVRAGLACWRGGPGMLAHIALWAAVSAAISPAPQETVELVQQFPT